MCKILVKTLYLQKLNLLKPCFAKNLYLKKNNWIIIPMKPDTCDWNWVEHCVLVCHVFCYVILVLSVDYTNYRFQGSVWVGLVVSISYTFSKCYRSLSSSKQLKFVFQEHGTTTTCAFIEGASKKGWTLPLSFFSDQILEIILKTVGVLYLSYSF